LARACPQTRSGVPAAEWPGAASVLRWPAKAKGAGRFAAPRVPPASPEGFAGARIRKSRRARRPARLFRPHSSSSPPAGPLAAVPARLKADNEPQTGRSAGRAECRRRPSRERVGKLVPPRTARPSREASGRHGPFWRRAARRIVGEVFLGGDCIRVVLIETRRAFAGLLGLAVWRFVLLGLAFASSLDFGCGVI
jgi:hypothetical protein